MKVVFTGGGTGGHFYPLIAVAQQLNDLIDKENIAEARLYYFAPTEYDKQALFEQRMEFRSIPAGKLRLGGSLKNLLDFPKTIVGIFQALWQMFKVYPDVVFSKGGYAAFPTLVAARILGIPVVMHESDTVPGRVNKWTARFAKKIAISYPDAFAEFPEKKTAHTGQPIRRELLHPTREGAREYLRLSEDVPTILILGGSQGAERINEVVLQALPQLLEKYQVIHQVGEANKEEYERRVSAVITEMEYRSRYKVFGFLNPLASSMAAGIADIVISRAGSTIFEISAWQIPSIIIPIPRAISRDQESNAFAYARSGAAIAMEENNLGPRILVSEINRIIGDREIAQAMREHAKDFFVPDAAKKIAEQIISIGLSHE